MALFGQSDRSLFGFSTKRRRQNVRRGGAAAIGRFAAGELLEDRSLLTITAIAAAETVIQSNQSVLGELPPVLAPIANQVAQPGVPLTLQWSATDPNNYSVFYQLDPSDASTGATVNISSGAFNFTPTQAQVGDTIRFVAIVTDEQLASPFRPLADAQVFDVYVAAGPTISLPGAQTVGTATPLPFTGVNAISIADSDIPSADSISTTLNVTNGSLSLGDTAGLTFTGGTSNDSNTLTFTGTISNINTDLASLTYTSIAGFTGADTLNVSVNDLGNSGASAPLTASGAVAINVEAVNQAPTISVPGAQVAGTGVTLGFNSTNGNAISVADVDSDGGAEQVTLSAAQGTLTLADTTGLTIDQGANDSSSLAFTGTISDINNALAGLSYTSNSGYTGSDTISITINDQGNTGLGGPQSAAAAVPISVESLAVTPVVNVPAAQNVGTALPLALNGANVISISDPGVSSTDDVSTTLSVADGTLSLGVTSGLTFTAGTSNGSGTLTFTGTISDINNDLASLTYTSTAGFTGFDTLNVSVSDLGNGGFGGPLTGTGSVSLDVSAINQAPTISVPGAQVAGAGVALGFNTTNGNAISVADVDSDGGDEQVTLSAGQGTLTFANTTGLTFDQGTANGTSMLVFTGTISDIDNDLATLSYTSNSGFTGSDTLSLTINDQGNTGLGGPQSATATVPITVESLAVAPVVNVPGSQIAGTALPLAFTGGNAISISDPGVPSTDNVSTTLNATNGTLSLGVTTGLTFTGGTANGSGTLTFTGTISNINSDLASLTYVSTAGFTGFDTLNVSVNDLGNGGFGGPLTGTGSVSIDVTQANQAPTISAPGAQVAGAGLALGFNTTNGNALSVADVDSDGGDEQLTLSVAQGTLTFDDTTGLTFDQGTANGSNTLIVTGTISDLDNALSGLSYSANAGYVGSDTLSVAIDDEGNTGLGGPLTATATVPITVAAPPVNTLPASPISVLHDVTTAITGVSVADPAAGTNDISVALVVGEGTLTVATVSPNVQISGNNSGNLVLVGTVADIDADLAATNGLTYLPSAGFTGTDSLVMVSSDLGNVTVSGPLTATSVLTINVLPTNQPPVITAPGTQTVEVGTPLQFTISASDPNGFQLTYQIIGVEQQPSGSPNSGGATIDPISGSFTWTPNTAGTYVFLVSATNNGIPPLADTADVTIVVTAPPVFNSISQQSATVGQPEQFTLSATDPQGTQLTYQLVQVVQQPAGANNSGSAAIDPNSGAFTWTPNTPGTYQFLFTATDSSAPPLASSITVTVVVAEPDQPPVNTVPAAQTTNSNAPLVFSSTSGNAITVADPDALSTDVEQVSLSVAQGTLTLGSGSGVNITTGSNGSASLTVQGTLAQLNAALNQLTYTPTTNFIGQDTLTVATNDLGHNGNGGPLTTTSTIAISVQVVAGSGQSLAIANPAAVSQAYATAAAVPAGRPSATGAVDAALAAYDADDWAV